MSYQILYGREPERARSGHRGRRLVMTFLFFIVFLWSVCSFWPEGRTLLQTMLIPGDPTVTLEAAQVFAQELGCGFSLADAAGNFRDAVLGYGFPG